MPSDRDRDLDVKTITHFRGISLYRSIAGQPMEWAQDLLNVIVGGAGFLEKFRVPVLKADKVIIDGAPQPFIDTMYDFQQANGTRQLIANFVQSLGYYDPAFTFTLIEQLAQDTPRFSYVDSNNLLFMGNTQRALKWDGASLWMWGIDPPATAPTLGIRMPILHLSRTANVVTITLDTSGVAANSVGVDPAQFKTIPAGDTVAIDGIDLHPEINGLHSVTAPTGTATFTLAIAGGDFSDAPDGFCTIYTTPCANTGADTDFNITQISRSNNVATVLFTNLQRIFAGEPFTLASFTGALAAFNGDYGQGVSTFSDATKLQFTSIGPDIVATVPGGTPKISGGFTDVLGPRTWRASYGRQVLGHESPGSEMSSTIPTNNGLVSNVRAYVNIPAPTDPQVDQYFLYATLDSGSDWFLERQASPLTAPNILTVGDGFDDSAIDTTQRINFLNYPPGPCSMLSKWQARIYFVETADPQVLVYTGYEKILRGRPEESVPPFNRIQLQVGANNIKAHGPLINGVVIWDQTDHMFMFRGTVEDITTDQPVAFAESLEDMPWAVGAYSHQSVKPTPYGLVWFGSDNAFHKWSGVVVDGITGPSDISENIAPLLRRITPGTQYQVQAEYFNFLERDWYVALIAIDGSATYNRMIFFDLSTHADDNLGIFISDIEADSICTQQDANGDRHLLISVRGQILELQTATTATAGIHRNMTKTSGELNAYWVSGYDGNDTPLHMKMYRFGRLVSDQTGFKLLVTLVNDEASTFQNPIITKQFNTLITGKFAVNWKARRMSVSIQFPIEDVDASVLQLSVAKRLLGIR
jgi:hypothetical protein